MVIHSIRTVISRWRRREEGQAIVEFALIAPIFLLLVLGIVEFGKAWMTRQALIDASREGARTAAVANPTITLDSVAARMNTNMAAAGIDTAAAVKTVTGFQAGTGTEVAVSISYPYHLGFLQPFMGWTSAQASFNLNSYSAMRNE